MEEDTTRPATQNETLADDVVENPPEDGAAPSALQVTGAELAESVVDDQCLKESSASVEESSALHDATSTPETPTSMQTPEGNPQDAAVPTNDGTGGLSVPVDPAISISDDPSELPTPPAKDNISNIPPHPVESSSVPPSIPAESEGRRPHTPSHSSAVSSSGHKRSFTMSKGTNVSVVLIVSALETIAASKEAKRSAPLRDSTQRALELIRSDSASDHPRDILEPLRLACETKNEKLMIASLDCISKLISYSFFAEDDIYVSNGMLSPPPSPHPSGRSSIGRGSQASIPQPSIVDLVVHTITACHTETTPETVSLQIVKALLALVLSPSVFVHHSSLLKTVRTVYNVFLLSTDPVNQMVAQGGLTQMVHHIFTRCKTPDGAKPLQAASTPSFDSQGFAASSHASLTAVQPEDTPKSTNGSMRSENSGGKGEPGESSTSLPLSPKDASETEVVQEPDESRDATIPQMCVAVAFRSSFFNDSSSGLKHLSAIRLAAQLKRAMELTDSLNGTYSSKMRT